MLSALFALPLAVSTFSSFPASVNLIAFYLVWATLVFSSPPLRIELVGTVAVRLLFYVLPSLVFFLFDLLVPSLAVALKAHGERGLPGGKKRGRVRLTEIKVAGWALLNLFLGIAVQGAIEFVRTTILGWPRALRVEVKLPMPWEIVTDLTKGLVGREVRSPAALHVVHGRTSYDHKFNKLARHLIVFKKKKKKKKKKELPLTGRLLPHRFWHTFSIGLDATHRVLCHLPYHPIKTGTTLSMLRFL